MIKAIIKFILLSTTGKMGVELIKENLLAGIIFFLISAGAIYSMLLEFNLIDSDTIPNILKKFT
jgi:hypothetical protein